MYEKTKAIAFFVLPSIYLILHTGGHIYVHPYVKYMQEVIPNV